MASSNYGPYISAKAASDLSAKQYFIVKITADDEIDLAGAGEGIGVLTDEPAAGKYGTVQVQGITKVVAGGAISAGDAITSDGNGNAVAATASTSNTSTGAITGSMVLGRALKTAAQSGDVIPVVITHSGALPGTLA